VKPVKLSSKYQANQDAFLTKTSLYAMLINVISLPSLYNVILLSIQFIYRVILVSIQFIYKVILLSIQFIYGVILLSI
jgi:hypothetical protein